MNAKKPTAASLSVTDELTLTQRLIRMRDLRITLTDAAGSQQMTPRLAGDLLKAATPEDYKAVDDWVARLPPAPENPPPGLERRELDHSWRPLAA